MALPYVGRFAPSPTGNLHLGSLACALASYLDAKRYGGKWLLRIEDIDPPREQTGAAVNIIASLSQHGLEPDGDILWQSQRADHYQQTLALLAAEDLTYSCDCSRQRLLELGGRYDGKCRREPAGAPAALRLKVSDLPAGYGHIRPQISFIDRHLGRQEDDLTHQGDFIIHRKDGLFAYQLAVVVDDIAQGITQVVRGNDILETTARQLFLYRLLGYEPPNYCHIPVISNAQGQKLSKQNFAPALDGRLANQNLWRALSALGAQPPPQLWEMEVNSIINWAIDHWQIEQLPHQAAVSEKTLACPADL